MLKKRGAVLVRKFALKGPETKGLNFLAAAGTTIDAMARGRLGVDEKLTVHVDPSFSRWSDDRRR